MNAGAAVQARRRLTVARASQPTLAAWESGSREARAVVLLHGVTMTGDQVLGSTAEIERSGFRVISYDARGHGRSEAARDRDDYGYELLLDDLLAVLEECCVERALLAGVSMGAHTAVRLAIEQPERVAGLVVISPAYDPEHHPSEENVQEADRLARALREQGAAGVPAALSPPQGYTHDSAIVRTGHAMTRRRFERHLDLEAVADALEVILRAKPFRAFAQLQAIGVPALVVGTRDQFDPRHPLALAEAYAAALPNVEFACEEPGSVPLGWGGRRLSALIARLAERATWEPEQ
jgi:pimeloyl-ACP methyl ester carboxylesterase